MAKGKTTSETTIRLPLVGAQTNRGSSTTTDQRFVNCFPEMIKNGLTDGNRIYLMKRFGLTRSFRPRGTAGEGRGFELWNNKFYSVIGNTLYETNTSTLVSTAKATLTTYTGAVGFIETMGINNYLFLCDGVKGYVISTTGVVTMITDPDFPTPHITTPTFMDGYVFLLKTNGDICNSVLEDPTSWDASNFITADSFPDLTVALARQNNLVVALGETSVEFFYDAGNATGSPLGTTPYTIQFGCASIGSITQEESLVTFVCKSKTGGVFISIVDGVNPTTISTEPINRILHAEGEAIQYSWAYITRAQGHSFYVLNLPIQRRTLVYDYDEKMWHEWSWNTGTSQDMFPFSWRVGADSELYFLHETDGYVYKASVNTYTDNGNAIQVLIQTSRFDGDTAKVKFLSKLEFICDRQTTSSPISVSYSDDDYQSWSSARTVDLNNRAVLWRLGSFRRRAFLFTHQQNTPFRIEAVEMDLDIGSH